jgi:hypothetical protein
MGEYTLGFIDESRETAGQRLNLGPINALTIAGVEGQLATLLAKTEALSLCQVTRESLIAYNNFVSRAVPSNLAAQRENKWLITYEDTTTHKTYKSEMPGADTSLLVAGTDYVDLAGDARVSEYVTAFNAVVQSPAGHSVAILSIKFVGRNT